MTHRNADNSSPGAAVFEEENSAAVARHKLEDPAASDASSSSAAAASVTSSELATKTNGVHSHEQVNFMIHILNSDLAIIPKCLRYFGKFVLLLFIGEF